ncbi:TIGR00730 family Rossman fold protein [Staphylococcus sp. EZ-P03]|uniref:LOG family protein n=1 Tax=Staphylococcus sp. EZ-P03 TaxID=2282739 RepID=UPI000DF7C029|nr:TIGR00730 family Rossman fold protein [Staphylococcus sp. EZ-P03]
MNFIVYCGASEGKNEIYRQAAQQLGEWMAQKGYGLVYGGGNIGLMGKLADTIKQHKGHVIGVMPKFLEEKEIAHQGLDELIIVDTMAERKAAMLEKGDVCIALPGGPGTLEEITEMVSWARIGQNDNPCIFFNVSGYYDKMAAFYDQMVEEGFVSQADRDLILFTDDFDALEDFIHHYEAPHARKYN